MRYAVTILLGSFLLFQVQPLIARFILPWFGGSPAVWTTCLLFFQVALLGGYAYAHGLGDRLRTRSQALVHLVVLLVSLAALPVLPSPSWKTAALSGQTPVFVILALLAVTVGAPYVVLATTSPLLQHWFARTRPGRSPYRLFALSNLGSLLGLVTYPFVFEPLLTLRTQARLWSVSYLAYAALCGLIAVEAYRVAGKTEPVHRAPSPPAAPVPFGERMLWLALAAAGTLALMATSNHMVQDVASVPLLWVLPLALYLFTLVVCFDHERWATRSIWLPAFLLILPVTIYLLFRQDNPGLFKQIAVYSAALVTICMVVHGELARRKPHASRLTSFYLHVAAGGALGGAFVTFAAPFLFDGYWEYQVTLVVTWILAGVGLFRALGPAHPVRRWVSVAWGTGGVALVAVLWVQVMQARLHPIESRRNFYGVLRVSERTRSGERIRSMYNNRVLHGSEVLSGPHRGQSITYYGPRSGIALAVEHHPLRRTGQPLQIGVIGLGTGSIAGLAHSGDRVRYYEIDPEVKRLAEKWFDNLHRPDVDVTVVFGDARLSLEGELQRRDPPMFDLLVVDAFTGDAIPVHLLTREAIAVYLAHLRPGGILVLHISNGRLDLRPLARGLARVAGLDAVMIDDTTRVRGIYNPSQFVLMARSAATLGDSAITAHADPAFGLDRRTIVWTDDFSNLLRVLR